MKNILIVSQFAAQNMGNYIATLLDFRDFLENKGIHSFFAFPDSAADKYWLKEFDKKERPLLLPSKPKLGRFKYNPAVKSVLYSFCKENEIDLIHSNFDGYDKACCDVSRSLGIALVISLHNSLPTTKNNNYLRQIYYDLRRKFHYRISLRSAHFILVGKDCNSLKNQLGIKNYSIICNGISLKRFTPNFSHNGQRFLMCVGSRFESKGGDRLIEYMANCHNDNIRVDVISSGSSDEKIKNSNDSRLTCIGGVRDMDSLFRNYDGIIFLTYHEAMSYFLLEAMYAGLPVIKSDAPGTNWANGKPSVFVVRNSREFCDAIANVRKLDSKACAASSDFIAKNYNNTIWCEKRYNKYLEVSRYRKS